MNIKLKLLYFIAFSAFFTSCNFSGNQNNATQSRNVKTIIQSDIVSATVDNSELYTDSDAYCVVNRNVPFFYESEYTTEAFESYSPLDELGRCGVAYANICTEITPTEERGQVGSIKPSGWHTIKYEGIVEGNYLYNRCHLIGFQLAGENSNECNLITGTRYLNNIGMLPFENKIFDYVKETGNHVLYRVTPKFEKNNLLSDGVLLEAHSVEDNGKLEFCVFCYNIQPQITIDYKTGESKIYDGTPLISEELNIENSTEYVTDTYDTDFHSQEIQQTETEIQSVDIYNSDEIIREYIINTDTKKFHLPECPSVESMKEENKQTYYGSREQLSDEGYQPCKRCNP